MSPAQAELEAKDEDIAKLATDLAEAQRLLTEALGAIEISRETIATLQHDLLTARLETESVYATGQNEIKRVKALLLKVSLTPRTNS